MTTERQSALQRQGIPPEVFIKQVRDALKSLYDFPHLQSHPLAQMIDVTAERSGEPSGQRLRRDTIAAIESLSPGPGVPFHAPQARLYNLLHLHYVEGMTIREVAHELGVSLRQAYRDLRRGEENVAAVLWARLSTALSQEPGAAQPSSIQAEIDRLETHPLPTDVRALLRHAQEAVEPMASRRSVSLDAELPESAVILTDPVVAQQVLVNILSHAVQQTRSGAIRLTLTIEERQASLTLRYALGAEAAGAPTIDSVVAQLLNRLRWTVEQEDRPEGIRVTTLHMATHGATLLAVDDNEGLVELLERYLTDQSCRVMAALSGQEGLRLAQELAPDVIVLDVMMPEMDGWEILQRIRTNPQTANTPVIICSVFDDPELAYSLGASLFLPKPVSQDDVLDALRRLGVL